MIIVTGAAGYIGAHICKLLADVGYSVIAIDNLSTGKSQFIDRRASFFRGDVQNRDFLTSTLSQFDRKSLKGVIHLAGLKFAGESVRDPLSYYDANTSGTQILLSTMRKFDIRNIVFSSSCSVYGNVPGRIPISEAKTLRPISPYGRSKLFAETIIQDTVESFGMRAISLRYFNVAGGTRGISSDFSRFNIFPNLFRAVTKDAPFEIFGSKYQTPDGTCIRDYVDVGILADAHIRCLESLLEGRELDFAYNLGSGVGYSVSEIVKAVSEVTGVEVNTKLGEPRPGDPAQVLADTSRAQRDLGWIHSKSLQEIAESAWISWKYFHELDSERSESH